MWINEITQKLKDDLLKDKIFSAPIEISYLKSIKASLLRHRNQSPDLVIKLDQTGLFHTLCELKVELDYLIDLDPANWKLNPVTHVCSEIENIINLDITFGNSLSMELSVNGLIQLLSVRITRRKKIRETIKYFALLAAILPALAFGLHWSVGNFFQQALLDEVSFVYPDDGFDLVDGKYRIKSKIIEDYLPYFRDQFFGLHELESGYNSPMHFNKSKAMSWGLEITDADYRSLNTPDNLVMFRTFIRNIRENNLVNKIFIEVENNGDSGFPWAEIDVDSKLIFSTSSYIEPTLTASPSPIPVVDLRISGKLHTKGVRSNYEFSGNYNVIDQVTEIVPKIPNRYEPTARLKRPKKKTSGVSLDALLSVMQPENHHHALDLLYIENSSVSGFSLDDRNKITSQGAHEDLPFRLLDLNFFGHDYDYRTEEFERHSYNVQLERNDGVNAYLNGKDYIYAECDDGGIAIALGNKKLRDFLISEQAKYWEFEYQYMLLNGIQKSGTETLDANYQFDIFKPGVLPEPRRAANCLGPLGYALGHLDIHDAIDMVPHDPPPPRQGPTVLNTIDKLALALSGEQRKPNTNISAEKTVLLDFANSNRASKSISDEIFLLQDGEYVLLKFLFVNFQGGNHTVKIYFEDKIVSEMSIVLPWPSTSKFDNKSIPEFTKVHRWNHRTE